MRYGAPCQRSMLTLRQVRSTLPTSASNHSTRPANPGSTGNAPGSRSSAPGRKSMPRFRPGLRRSRSWTSWSGSATPSAGSSSTVTSSGTGSPSPRASSPLTTSATSTGSPWPAPEYFTTYVPRSSASINPGSDPPSRSGVTYRRAVTWRSGAGIRDMIALLPTGPARRAGSALRVRRGRLPPGPAAHRHGLAVGERVGGGLDPHHREHLRERRGARRGVGAQGRPRIRGLLLLGRGGDRLRPGLPRLDGVVEAVATRAGRGQGEQQRRDGPHELPPVVGDEDPVRRVHEDRGPDHHDEVEGGDHAEQSAQDDQDATDDLDDRHEGGREDRHRDAHRLEALGRPAESVDHQLLVAVREHDGAEQEPRDQERDISGGRRQGAQLDKPSVTGRPDPTPGE